MTLETLFALSTAAAAAYMSTNIDGFALLLDFFSNENYRASEIAAGQLASVAVQLAMSIAVIKLGYVEGTPFIGLAGIVPLGVGLKRIATWRSSDIARGMPAPGRRPGVPRGTVARLAAVATIATCGAIDNVVVYAALLVGHGVADLISVSIVFAALTVSLCVLAFTAVRARVSVPALRTAACRLAPFMTTAVGAALLVRFGTLGWIYSLA
jgi:cadmium resistance protein CadD (predicted permease)